MLACTVLATGTQQEASASHGGTAINQIGNNNTVNLNPKALQQLGKNDIKIIAMLENLTQRQNSSEQEQQLRNQNQQLKEQMKQLSQQLARATANHNADAIQAVEGLHHGNLTPTADYLRAIAQKARSEGIAKNAQAAQAAQAMRQLASISTTLEAVKALQSACDYEPDNTLNWKLLGNMHLQAGNVARAKGAYTQMLRLAQTATRSHPNDLHAQRDLSVSYEKIGEIQHVQGDLKGALASYQATHAILKTLAKKDAGNVQGQTDLVVSYWKLAHVSQGNESKGFLRQGLAILEQLARENRLDADQKSRWLPLFRNALAH